MAADLPKIQRSLERGENGISHFIWNGATFQPETKMTNGYQIAFFPVMEWSTGTKTGYDDLEVYMEYGYVFVSSTGKNHVKMAAFSFKYGWKMLDILLMTLRTHNHQRIQKQLIALRLYVGF